MNRTNTQTFVLSAASPVGHLEYVEVEDLVISSIDVVLNVVLLFLGRFAWRLSALWSKAFAFSYLERW